MIGIFASTRSSPTGSPAFRYASAALTRASNARRAPSIREPLELARQLREPQPAGLELHEPREMLVGLVLPAGDHQLGSPAYGQLEQAGALGERHEEADEIALRQRGLLLFEKRRKGRLLLRRESAGDEVAHLVQTRGQRVRERRRVPVRPEGRRCLGARGKQPIEDRRRLAKPGVDADVRCCRPRAGRRARPAARPGPRTASPPRACARARAGRRRRRRSRLAPGARRRAPSGAPSPRRPRGPDAREARRSFPSTADRDTSARTSWRSWRPRRRIASIALRGCRGRSGSRRGRAGWRSPSRTPRWPPGNPRTASRASPAASASGSRAASRPRSSCSSASSWSVRACWRA